MPTRRDPGEVSRIWQDFVKAVREILPGLPSHRPLDQFRRAQLLALQQAESPEAAADLESAYDHAVSPPDGPRIGSAEVVLLELEALPLALGVHHEQVKAGTAQAGAVKVLGKTASLVLGSVLDLFNLSAFGKGVVTALREALDIANAE